MIRPKLRRLFILNRRGTLLFGTLFCLVMFGVVAWRTGAQGTRSANGDDNREHNSEVAAGPAKIEGDRVEIDSQVDDDARDSPPDTTPYWRPAIREDHIKLPKAPLTVTATVVDLVVNNTNTGLAANDTFNDSETNIAVDPANPNNI